MVADKIGFDLGEGLVLIPGKTLKGTGSMNQDGIVSVDLYLQEV